MWNSFHGALEKRVRDGAKKKVVADKYIILKVTHQVLMDMFGLAGRENIAVSYNEQRKVMLSCNKSIWRSELTLNLATIKKQIFAQVGKESIQDIIVVK